jgi:DNA-binding PadR family transcriptional regulator
MGNPLREPTFFILLSLAPGKKHGYAILKDVEDLSGGKIRLSTGTLYEALSRLLDQGLIRRVANEEDGSAGRPRKTYTLTSGGRRLLESEANRMQSWAALARARLAGEGA